MIESALHASRFPLMATARHRWLLDLTHVPTTSGREQRVVDWVKAWVERRDDLKVATDSAGNLLLTVKGAGRRSSRSSPPPTWTIPGSWWSRWRRDVTAGFMGGVMAAVLRRGRSSSSTPRWTPPGQGRRLRLRCRSPVVQLNAPTSPGDRGGRSVAVRATQARREAGHASRSRL
jgi:hypothetical protein